MAISWTFYVSALCWLFIFRATWAHSCRVTELYRYAVKGLSGDVLHHVQLPARGCTFPDDRRYALLERRHLPKWQGGDQNGRDATVLMPSSGNRRFPWLHKQLFLCAFTAPELMATLQTRYSEKDKTLGIMNRSTQQPLLHTSLATTAGRQTLAKFMSSYAQRDVVCITADDDSDGTIGAQLGSNVESRYTPDDDDDDAGTDVHLHQFCNTSSGMKQRQDTRTIHIVNANTVRELSQTWNVHLRPSRFRPNVVIDDMPAWSEFDWVGRQVQSSRGVVLSVLTRTVRCRGVSIDPLDNYDKVSSSLDVPALLARHYPEHGPYFGVYAAVDVPGTLQVGDTWTVL